jgi:hypothetical protein
MVVTPRYDQYKDAWDTSVLAEVIYFCIYTWQELPSPPLLSFRFTFETLAASKYKFNLPLSFFLVSDARTCIFMCS